MIECVMCVHLVIERRQRRYWSSLLSAALHLDNNDLLAVDDISCRPILLEREGDLQQYVYLLLQLCVTTRAVLIVANQVIQGAPRRWM